MASIMHQITPLKFLSLCQKGAKHSNFAEQQSCKVSKSCTQSVSTVETEGSVSLSSEAQSMLEMAQESASEDVEVNTSAKSDAFFEEEQADVLDIIQKKIQKRWNLKQERMKKNYSKGLPGILKVLKRNQSLNSTVRYKSILADKTIEALGLLIQKAKGEEDILPQQMVIPAHTAHSIQTQIFSGLLAFHHGKNPSSSLVNSSTVYKSKSSSQKKCSKNTEQAPKKPRQTKSAKKITPLEKTERAAVQKPTAALKSKTSTKTKIKRAPRPSSNPTQCAESEKVQWHESQASMEENLSYDIQFNHLAQNDLTEERLICFKDRKISKCLSDGDQTHLAYCQVEGFGQDFIRESYKELSFYSEPEKQTEFDFQFGEYMQPVSEEVSFEDLGSGIDQYINRDLWTHLNHGQRHELLESTYLGTRLPLNEEAYCNTVNWGLGLESERNVLEFKYNDDEFLDL